MMFSMILFRAGRIRMVFTVMLQWFLSVGPIVRMNKLRM
jgi:hypothetical protein